MKAFKIIPFDNQYANGFYELNYKMAKDLFSGMSVKFHQAIKTRHSELDSESHITVNQERIMRP